MASFDAAVMEEPLKTNSFRFQRFSLKDQVIFRRFFEEFSPQSCEYNFANLFAWQEVYNIFWTLYQDRLLIYDGLSDLAYMPLGRDFFPEELVVLSLQLEREGLNPDFGLATQEFVEKYPDLDEYYQIEELRDSSEYIYDVGQLVELSGTKLAKKKNLIAQFNRYYSGWQVHGFEKQYRQGALKLAQAMLDRQKRPTKTLRQEMEAIKKAVEYCDDIGLEGTVITYKDSVVAFSLFSRISASTYDVHFEKSNPEFKGAAQVVNQETARYLKGKCLFINREQDLGIKGLRQAKLSYDPIDLKTPYLLSYNPPE